MLIVQSTLPSEAHPHAPPQLLDVQYNCSPFFFRCLFCIGPSGCFQTYQLFQVFEEKLRGRLRFEVFLQNPWGQVFGSGSIPPEPASVGKSSKVYTMKPSLMFGNDGNEPSQSFKYHNLLYVSRKGIWKTRKNDIWKGEEVLPSIFLQPTSTRCSHQ